jgi:hypothetical protein
VQSPHAQHRREAQQDPQQDDQNDQQDLQLHAVQHQGAQLPEVQQVAEALDLEVQVREAQLLAAQLLAEQLHADHAARQEAQTDLKDHVQHAVQHLVAMIAMQHHALHVAPVHLASFVRRTIHPLAKSRRSS